MLALGYYYLSYTLKVQYEFIRNRTKFGLFSLSRLEDKLICPYTIKAVTYRDEACNLVLYVFKYLIQAKTYKTMVTGVYTPSRRKP